MSYQHDNFGTDAEWDFSAGSVFGFRWFGVDFGPAPTTVRFRLFGQRTYWQTDTLQASCALPYSDHPAVPDASCTCGVYAYWEPNPSPLSPYALPAVVQGYGKTIIGGLGFRSEHCTICAVTVTHHRDLDTDRYEQVLSGLSEFYPNVKVFGTVEEMLEAYPLTPDYKSQAPEVPIPVPSIAWSSVNAPSSVGMLAAYSTATSSFSISHVRVLDGTEDMSSVLLDDTYAVENSTITADVLTFPTGATVVVGGAALPYSAVANPPTPCSILVRVPSMDSTGAIVQIDIILYRAYLGTVTYLTGTGKYIYSATLSTSDVDEKGASLSSPSVGRIFKAGSQ